MRPIFYIDQQSYGNLSIYDYSLLSRINSQRKIHYFCNSLYDGQPFPKNIAVHKIFRYSGKQGLEKKLSYAMSVLQLLCFVIVLRPSVIHQQWIKATLFDLSIWKIARRLFGTRIIFTAHNVLPHIRTNTSLQEYRTIYSLCDRVISHTETSRGELIAEFPETESKVSIVPHGVMELSANRHDVERLKADYCRKYALDAKFIVGILGARSQYKGSDLILSVWKNTPEILNDDSIRLLAVGKTQKDLEEQMPKLTEGIPNLISIDRFIENDEFEALMELTDVMLMPYRHIDQSGLLLTIAQKEIPFCVSTVGELKKPLEIADVGWSFKSLDASDIRDKILEILHNRKAVAAKKNDKEGWRRIQQYYDWDKSALLTSRLYEF